MPPKAARARAKPKTKTKAKPRTTSTGVKFRSRGPFKCTVKDGVALKGMHPALAAAIGAGFDYAKAKANKSLRALPHPAATEFIPRHAHAKNERRLAYSATQGKKTDSQISAVVKLHLMPTQQVPLRAFVDAAYRDHFLLLKFGKTSTSPLVGKQIKRIRAVANGLLPETDAIVRYLISHQLTPVGTQTPVACGAVGTQCDLVVKNNQEEHIVCEIKCGCETNWTHGKLMPRPLADLLFTTHREHTLQTLMTTRCYKRTFPQHKVGSGLLLRSARDGLHVYATPAWAKDAEQALAAKMLMP
jgi:hypothetical protein